MKRILPPHLFVLCAVCMICCRLAFTSGLAIPYPYNLPGLGLILAGVRLAVTSKRIFLREKTNVQTFDDPDKLIVEGPFRYSRNPMYLGFLIALSGLAILLGEPVTFMFAAAFFLVTQRGYIPFEEKAMTRTFGEEYLSYKSKVRRWI